MAIDRNPYPFNFDILGIFSGSLAKVVILAPPILKYRLANHPWPYSSSMTELQEVFLSLGISSH